jgi:hypothetical protein
VRKELERLRAQLADKQAAGMDDNVIKETICNMNERSRISWLKE